MKKRQRIRRVPYLAPTSLGVEVMTFARMRRMDPPAYRATPQRTTFHVLVLVTGGTGTHMVDFRAYPLSATRAVWIRPGQVQTFDETAEPTGDLVLFESDFLMPGTQAAAIADDRFGQVAFDLASPVARAAIRRAQRELKQEYLGALDEASQQTPVRAETLRHLLSVLILRISSTSPETERDAPDDLFVRFRELLERDFAIAHDVAYYAHRLNYSSRTLARVTDAAIGLTPKQMIQERVALEARRLLAHTDLPIVTVAMQVGFRDPSNFSSFFAHQTRESPTAFREQQRGRPVDETRSLEHGT